MKKHTKTILFTSGLVLVLAGTGAGVATAQTTHHPGCAWYRYPRRPGPPSHPSRPPQGQPGRAVHGEFTVHTKTGDKILDTQRGVVTAVNAGSVTVKSTDGFTATYTLTPTTKVHKGKQTATTTRIATNTGTTATNTGTTATHIGDAGPTK